MEARQLAMRILIVTDFFLPGIKGGGLIRTNAHLVQHLGEEFDFYVLTRDRDLGDSQPYPDIVPDTWVKADGYTVCYLSPSGRSIKSLRAILRETKFDLIYQNSFFSTITVKVLVMRRLGLLAGIPIVLAPQGEFSPGALSLKRRKKRLYIALARMLDLCRNVIWQASTPLDEQDIRNHFGDAENICIVPDLPPKVAGAPLNNERLHRKRPGEARFVFLSRISRMKNLDAAIDMLRNVRGKVQFDIFGPIGDKAYWLACEKSIATLPENIVCRYRGISLPTMVREVLSGYDFFFLPTRGEAFGHAILESLIAGCPVIISDATSWRGLQQLGIGWDLPLDEPERFVATLQQCVDMDGPNCETLSKNALEFGLRMCSNPEAVDQRRQLFLNCARLRA